MIDGRHVPVIQKSLSLTLLAELHRFPPSLDLVL